MISGATATTTSPQRDPVFSSCLWLDQLDDPLKPRPALPGDRRADVAIVGAGYTGLWTAYYLRRLLPDAEVVVLEREIAGFGASGRNGGWCSPALPIRLDALAARHGRSRTIDLQRAALGALHEVRRVIAAEGIDCAWRHGGVRYLATNEAQRHRLETYMAGYRGFAVGPEHLRLLSAAQTHQHLAAEGVVASLHSPHCAVLQPAALTRGLAVAAERAGARIYEQTAVTAIRPRKVETDRGTVHADVVIRATEGYTPTFRGQRRELAPIYSYMIATEPLPPSFWEAVGWSDHAAVADGRCEYLYLQRTADDRIAAGGGASVYPFRSRVRRRHDHRPALWALTLSSLLQLFPAAAGARITHSWGGPLALARDFHPSVGFDRSSGLGWGGGYFGDGVALANLAGRTLAHLVAGLDTPETQLCWVGHRSPRWEVEPLRWLGIRLTVRVPRSIDRHEEKRGTTPPMRAWLFDYLQS